MTIVTVASFVTITLIWVGLFFRQKAIYGILSILFANIMRIGAEAGDDLWSASFLFMMLGAVICVMHPLKKEMQKDENKKEG